MNILVEIFSPYFLFRNALIAALLLGIFSPIVGRHLVLSRTVMLGLAIPQLSLLGVALAFLGYALGWPIFSFLHDDSQKAFAGATLITIPVLIALSFRKKQELSEGWLAFVYLAAIAATNLILSSHVFSENYISELFYGRLILISDRSLIFLTAILFICSSLAILLRKRILLILTDSDFATSVRLRVTSWRIFLALLNGLMIGSAVSIVGPIVAFGFIILPVLAASALAKSLRSHLNFSILFGFIMAFAGFLLSYRYDLPLGPSVVAIGCFALIGIYLIKRIFLFLLT